MGAKRSVYVTGGIKRLVDMITATDIIWVIDEAPELEEYSFPEMERGPYIDQKPRKSKSKHKRRAEKYPSFKQKWYNDSLTC